MIDAVKESNLTRPQYENEIALAELALACGLPSLE